MMENKAVLSTQAAVVGALLIDPAICGELFAETRAEDLVTASYRDVYEAARSLFLDGQPVDPLTVLDRMGGGTETRRFLGEIMDVTPSAANWREYARLLREQARLWRLQRIGAEMAQAQTLEAARELLQRAQAEGSDLGRSNAVNVQAGLLDFLQRITEPVRYMQFGIGGLDRRLFASLGDFIVIGGRPSAGKTLLSIQMADTLSRTYRVGYFSLETGPKKFFDRFFTQAVPLNFNDVKRHTLKEEDFQALAYQKHGLMERKLDVIPAGGYSAADIQSETLARRYQVIFVDYLQLVRVNGGKGGNRTEEVGAVSRALHTLSQKHNVLVIALAQLSRGVKNRDGSENAPTMSDLRESGQIEQDADAVLLLYRTDPKDPNSDRRIKVAKNKEGVVGAFDLAFIGRTQQLVERMAIPAEQGPRETQAETRREKRHEERRQLSLDDTGREDDENEGA